MRNFIVSDLHGNGNIYNSIISYLENLCNNSLEDITLYINGDLIDRGSNSGEMLIDVKNRVLNKNKFSIKYLAGNHELMMYQTPFTKNGNWSRFSNWVINNSGGGTAKKLEELLSNDEKEEMIDFISNLDIYHKFEEKIDDKNIVLVHAKCPKEVKDECDLKIKDNNILVENLVWTRRNDYFPFFSTIIGNEDYFTIIGHTINTNRYGYKYYEDENYLNIDGGCAGYALGYKEFDHTPLVEIDSKNNRLIILTFNNNNEIIYGNYFKNKKSKLMSKEELDKYRKYLKKNLKIKKLVNNIDKK